MIVLQKFNQLIMTSAITQPAPLTRTSKILQGKQIHMYGLYTSHKKIAITPKDKFQYQWTLIYPI